jgi:hypothetical protein
MTLSRKAMIVFFLVWVAATVSYLLVVNCRSVSGVTLLTRLSQSPVFITFNPCEESGLYIADKSGYVFGTTFEAEAKVLFLDIHSKVDTRNNKGLFCIAFHPLLLELVVMFASKEKPDTMVVSQFGLKFNEFGKIVVDTETEQVLLEIPQVSSVTTGGWLGFSPVDKYLYISTSDGDSQMTPQNLMSLNGKILRIEIFDSRQQLAYRSPVSNPFYSHSNARDEVWAYGLTNAWRCSFDRVSGDLFIGNTARQIQDLYICSSDNEGGVNFGWPQRLGVSGDGDFVKPVYRNQRFHDKNNETGLICGYTVSDNMLVLAHTSANKIFLLDVSTGLALDKTHQAMLPVDASPVSFGQDKAGRLFLCDISGRVFHIRL